MFQDFHAVAEIGKVRQNLAVDELNGRLPVGGKVEHQCFHHGQIDVVVVVVAAATPARLLLLLLLHHHVGLRLLHESNHFGKGRQQFFLDKLFPKDHELLEQFGALLARHAAFLKDGQTVIEVVDEKDGAFLLRRVFLRQAFQQLQKGFHHFIQILQQPVAGRLLLWWRRRRQRIFGGGHCRTESAIAVTSSARAGCVGCGAAAAVAFAVSSVLAGGGRANLGGGGGSTTVLLLMRWVVVVLLLAVVVGTVQNQQNAATKFRKATADVVRVQVDRTQFVGVRLLNRPQVPFHDRFQTGPQQVRDLIKKGIERPNLALSRGAAVRVRHFDHEQQAEGIVTGKEVSLELLR